jgi:alkaline phosphatase D
VHNETFMPPSLRDSGWTCAATAAPNTPPSGGFRFFGQIDIDLHSKHLTATLKDLDGATVFTKRLDAKTGRRDD